MAMMHAHMITRELEAQLDAFLPGIEGTEVLQKREENTWFAVHTLRMEITEVLTESKSVKFFLNSFIRPAELTGPFELPVRKSIENGAPFVRLEHEGEEIDVFIGYDQITILNYAIMASVEEVRKR